MPEPEQTEAPSPAPSKPRIGRLIAASRYSMAGLRAAIAHEESFRLELLIFLVMAPLGIWLGESSVERVLLVGTLVLVILVELLNTAIEKSSIVSAGITMTFPGTPKTWARLPC